MKNFFLTSACVLGSSAYPFVLEHLGAQPRQLGADDPLGISQNQGNCGPRPCLIFNEEEQLVSTDGMNAYQAPATSDIRGPCPGLNAAANHGYLNRNGILTITNTADGLAKAYGFEPGVSAALAVFASIISGDIITEQWSIGGPLPFLTVGNLLSPPQGISYSHNKYEGDVSIGRMDAYLGNGDAHSLDITRFNRIYEACTDDRCTLDKFRRLYNSSVQWSIENNPYYFSPPLAGTVVPLAAHHFVINLMSNHSAEEPEGYLNRDMLKQFFAVSGEYPNHKWNPGQERIPDNWYRRPSTNQYNVADVAADNAISYAAYPGTFRLGGNTAGVNTYKGVDASLLSAGTYDLSNLTQGNNMACLAFQAQQLGLPDQFQGLQNELSAALRAMTKYIAPAMEALGCPELSQYDGSLFDEYPGRTYSPSAPNNS